MPPSPTTSRLRDDALAIWHAGLAAVRSDQLVRDNLRVEGDHLIVGNEVLPLARIRRMVVVGAGKAGAGMAAGVEDALGPAVLEAKHVTGWVNVSADCVRPLTKIHLHAARPAGINEPTAEGVFGTEKILELVGSLGPADLCLCLISGGGSALLPAPIHGVTLAEKRAITRLLSSSGANIDELNTVRMQLSQIKGGGLARRCRAGRLIALAISDVLGDPLDVIASGPTVPDTRLPSDALAILERYAGGDESIAPGAFEYLRVLAWGESHETGKAYNVGEGRVRIKIPGPTRHAPCQVTNLVIGNNALAVDAAGREAIRRGYSPAMTAATTLEGPAEDIGIQLACMARQMAEGPGHDCLITGGEPIVRLVPPELRGKGGRNQQLVLAALAEICNQQSAIRNPKFVLLSAGTDGEDGPTDAAGAIIDGDLLARLAQTNLDPRDFLRRNDAYHFFERLGGLIKTGPTHTNVCDVRVVLVDRQSRG